MSNQYQAIREAFTTLRQEKVRHRDIAAKLNISEGELIAAHVGASLAAGDQMEVTCLANTWPDIIAALEPVGDILALTRNESCVHEKTGVYKDTSVNGPVGLALGEIDQRIFYMHWAVGFAVKEADEQGEKNSLQFFDKTGMAIHKIYLKPQSNKAEYDKVVARFTAATQVTGMTTLPAAPPAAEKPDAEIDVAGLRQAWADMQDTHAFFGILRKFGVTRTQALRLAEPRFAQKLDPSTTRRLLESAVEQGVSIMVFVGNPGMIQIHTGPVQKFAVMGPWLNILDPRFNLHLREDHIVESWVVRKPTADGIVTAIEIFDENGKDIAMFFGERKPGVPELVTWQQLVANLEKESAACAA